MEEKEKKAESMKETPDEAGLQELLEEKDKELADCKEQTLRLAAELDNFKKRMEKEKAEHKKYALEDFSNDLLLFIDNLERAVAAAKISKNIDKLIEGLELTLTGYLKILERYKLKRFVAEGRRFDPNFHEALSVVEKTDMEENIVVEELLKGYTLHEKVLRPALVIVSKKPDQEGGQKESNA